MKQFAILLYSGIKHFNAFLHAHHGVLPSCRSELTSCLSCVHELFCPDPGPCDPPCDHDHEPSCPEICVHDVFLSCHQQLQLKQL